MSLKDDVVNALRLAQAQPINFNVLHATPAVSHNAGVDADEDEPRGTNGIRMRADYLGHVADRVRDHRIRVAYNPRLSDHALYVPEEDRLELPRPQMRTIDEMANIVHECTHAVADLRGARTMRVVTGEAVAYISQTVFKLGLSGNNGDFTGYVDGQRITREALILAKRVRKVARDRVCTFHDGDLQSLRVAIMSHPTYKHLTWSTRSPENRGIR